MARTPGARIAHFLLIGSALLLPSLSLVPLGGLYLWQNGYLLWWALAALLTVAAVTLLQRRILGPFPAQRLEAVEKAPTPPDQAWGPLEEAAWADVEALAAEANLQDFTDASAFADLGRRTIEIVARRMHPEKPDALWQFTLPEALAITERVSRRLAGYVASHVPFGDSLTLAQFLSVYRWRWGIEVAERAYDIWRVLRFANPMTAVTHEARERLSRAALQWGRDHVARRLSGVFVEEVGRAAIDLYSGRLRVVHGEAQAAKDAGTPSRYLESPLTVLVAGGPRDERALVGDELQAHLLAGEIEGYDFAVSDHDVTRAGDIAAEVAACDILLWVYDGTAAEADAAVMKAITDRFATHRRLRPPAIIPVSIARDAVEAPQPPGDTMLRIGSIVVVTPSRLDREGDMAALVAAVTAAQSSGRRAHVARKLMGEGGARWSSVPRQVANSAGAIARALLRRRRKRKA